MENARAQFWSFDVIFAIVIFSVAITILGFAWYNINNQFSFSYGGGATVGLIQDEAMAQELMSPGSPSNWQSAVNTTNTLTWTNVSAGLASGAGGANLSMGKVYTLAAMASYNYQASKQLFGVGFDYFIIIKGNSMNLTIGSNPATSVISSEYVQSRSAFIDGQPVMIKVILWTSGLGAVA